MQQRDGLGERVDASQVCPPSGRAHADAGTSGYACLALPMGHRTLASTRRGAILTLLFMRVGVVIGSTKGSVRDASSGRRYARHSVNALYSPQSACLGAGGESASQTQQTGAVLSPV